MLSSEQVVAVVLVAASEDFEALLLAVDQLPLQQGATNTRKGFQGNALSNQTQSFGNALPIKIN